MSPENEIYADFYDEKDFEEIESKTEHSSELRKYLLAHLPLAVFLFTLFMGEFVFGA
jgi:hypothetical protein